MLSTEPHRGSILYIECAKMGCKRGTVLWLFCTPIEFRRFLTTHLECMAGTTGLEPATSAVTEIGVTDGFFWRFKVRVETLIGPLMGPRPLP